MIRGERETGTSTAFSSAELKITQSAVDGEKSSVRGGGQKLSNCSRQTFHKNYNYNPYKDLWHLSFYALVWRHLVIVSVPFYAALRFPSLDPVSKTRPQRGATARVTAPTLLLNKQGQFRGGKIFQSDVSWRCSAT